MMSAYRAQPSQPVIHVVDLVTTDKGKKFSPAGVMAAAIVDIRRENGRCLPQDLNAKGFSPAEVVEHWHIANSLAAVGINLMDEPATNPKS